MADQIASVLFLDKRSLFISLASITFNPVAWNLVARNGTSFWNIRLSVSLAKSIATEPSLVCLTTTPVMAATCLQFSFSPSESSATPSIIKRLQTNPEYLFCPNLSPSMFL